MSSLPDPNHLAATPSRRHRHRRSQAISGDFDAIGLGLFSPSTCLSSSVPCPNSNSNSNLLPSAPTVSKFDEMDRYYPFNNEDDFTNNPNESSFSFPNNLSFAFPSYLRSPDLKNCSPRNNSTLSPVRRSTMLHSNTLNSPIKLGGSFHRQTKSSSCIKTRRFSNDDSIPNAVIDLDEILNANLHVGDNFSNYNLKEQALEQISTDDIFPPDDDFLSSPFVKLTSTNPFINSPFYNNVNNTPIVEQPIEERTDSIAEEDDNDNSHQDIVDSDDEFFLHPPPTGGIYNNSSANSSTTSLRRLPTSHLIEKTFSNSSKDSFNSSSIPCVSNLTPPPVSQKRSGAKANRYQIFYDQSNRISNALKNSSSDSIHLVRTNSNGCNSSKDLRSLGHSSSLPSLKTLKRNFTNQIPRFVELRNTRVGSPPILSQQSSTRESVANEVLIVETPDEPDLNVNETNEESEVKFSNDSAEMRKVNNSKSDTTNGPSGKFGNKTISTSPISIESEASSTGVLSDRTTELTDHSSFHSEPIIISNKVETNNVTKTSDELFDFNINPPTFERTTTPSIVISSENDGSSSPSTDNTFKQDDVTNNSKNEFTIVAPETIKPLRFISPIIVEDIFTPSEKLKESSQISRRPLSPQEKNILELTQIPAYNPKSQKTINNTQDKEDKLIKKQSSSTNLPQSTIPSKFNHRKSKSFSTISMKSFINSTELEEDSIKKSKKRSSRLIGWFRKK